MVLMQGYQGSERGLWLVGNSRRKTRRKRRRRRRRKRRRKRKRKRRRRRKRRKKRRHLYLRKKRYVQKSVSAFRIAY